MSRHSLQRSVRIWAIKLRARRHQSEVIPLIKRELARIGDELNTTGWQCAENISILRNHWGTFGKRLRAVKLEGTGRRHVLMPLYLASDGNLYEYMSTDVARGYAKVRLRSQPNDELYRIYGTLLSTSYK